MMLTATTETVRDLRQLPAEPNQLHRPLDSIAIGLTGTETVLVAEDESGVRNLVTSCLRRGGYQVLNASDGAQALEMAQEREQPIDLLVTDIHMPGMTGRALAERFAELRPETKVLFISGYSDEYVVASGLIAANAAFIQKPFRPVALVNKVRELLWPQTTEASART